MIIVELNGGLGNQMFQYAAARRILKEKGVPLYLDTSILDYGLIGKGYTKRDYELSIFPQLEGRTYRRAIVKLGKGYDRLSALQFKLSKQIDKRLKGFETFREEDLIAEGGSRSHKQNAKLEGYFQSEMYFQSAAEAIRKDFTFPPIEDENNAKVAALISQSGTTVSVHVRRSDYLTAVHKDNHPACSVTYYENALALVRNKVGKFRCIVFSDDIDWARNNLRFLGGGSVFVNHNSGNKSFEDMRLMSLCQHHIIANSSFSWWGAWLNDHPRKIVVAPSKWFGAGKEKQNALIVPARWHRMS